MHGGLALCKVSLYSAKFFVLPMSLRMFSRVVIVLALTAPHVLLRRWIGAVPSAEMIDVSVEKLFSVRHFCVIVSVLSKMMGQSEYLHRPQRRNA